MAFRLLLVLALCSLALAQSPNTTEPSPAPVPVPPPPPEVIDPNTYRQVNKVDVGFIMARGFQKDNILYVSSTDTTVTGVRSLATIDVTQGALTDGNSDNKNIPATDRYVFGLSRPSSDEVFLAFTRGGSTGVIRRYKISTSEINITTSFLDCEEDLSTGEVISCNGTVNLTVTRTVLNAAVNPAVDEVQSYMLPIAAGVASWPTNRAYFASTGNSITIYEIDTTTMALVTRRELGATGFLIDMRISKDSSTIYIITDSKTMYKLPVANIASATLDHVALPYQASSFVLEEGQHNVAILASDETPSRLFMISLQTLTVSEEEYVMENAFAPRALFLNEQYGFLYIATFNSPSLLLRFNLHSKTFDLPPYALRGGVGRVLGGVFDSSSNSLHLLSLRDVVDVLLPLNCPNDCDGQAVCAYGGICPCPPTRQGPDCSWIPCAVGPNGQQCTGNGRCLENGTCSCPPGFRGSTCEIFTCPGDCGNQGTCDESSHKCSCDAGWGGDDCLSGIATLPCEAATVCSECARNPSCVWCETTSLCIDGDQFGPTLSYCPSWQYQDCPWPLFNVIAIILVVIAIIFIIVNAVTALLEDLGGDHVGSIAVRKSWYRSQRSAKAWTMVEQLQIAALTGLVGLSHPASYLAFLTPITWSLFSFPSMFEAPHIAQFTGRGLLEFTQRALTVGSHPGNLIFMPLACFVILALVLGLYRLIVQFVGDDSFKDRFIYMAIRLVILFQPSMTAFGGYALARAYGKGLAVDDQIASVIVGVIVALLFGVGVPVGAFFFLRNAISKDKKQFYGQVFRRRYGLLYEQYGQNRFWFGGIALAKRGILGLVIGILGIPGLGIGTIVLPMVIFLGYLIACVLLKPFLDPIMLVAEIIISIVNIITFGIMFFFLFPYGMGSNVVAIILVACTGASFLVAIGMWFVYVYRILTVSKSSPATGEYYEMGKK